MSKIQYPRLLIFNTPRALRICPELAAEIGLSESIVLLQLEFLISLPPEKIREGRRWTYQSIRHLREEYFPWWSARTINRSIKKLEETELIIAGRFNERKYDRTRWFALNEVGIGRLTSVLLLDPGQNARPIGQIVHMEGDNLSTPIPETPTENYSPNKNSAPSTVRAETPKAVKVFRAAAHRFPPKAWYLDIASRVGGEEKDLIRWGEHVKSWVGRGYNPINIEGILESFEAGGLKKRRQPKGIRAEETSADRRERYASSIKLMERVIEARREADGTDG